MHNVQMPTFPDHFVIAIRTLPYAFSGLVAEINMNVTLFSVMRLCGAPLGISNMSPLLSVMVVAPTDVGECH